MKNYELMKSIIEKIKSYQRIIIFRHYRPDGDAVGSTKGLQRILQLSFPEKEIYLQNSDYCDYMAFLGKEDEPIDESLYESALGIVVDTGTADRASNKKFSLCREIIKIDHHIDIKPYGDISWVEEERSSSCEMIAKFYEAFRDELVLDKEGATYIYTGMVTDSGRFRYRSVSGDTLRLAGMLLDFGIDTDRLYANLYLDEYNALKFKAYVYNNMKMTDNGVVYIYVDRRMQKRFGLTSEQASNVISSLDSIRGSLIWLAFIDGKKGDDAIRVRLRSRFVTVNTLAEKYSGGGHDCAAGATVYSKKEMKALIAEADARLAKYKSENEGWL
ncbi:MAG: bifunctional oligoribonuclease/PAP phosphatase NrnA [Clostridia bacterium]|nr:bifunctional oligoribonuclease/PAP phosphatase NrnA [Clostridia bacterium]